MILNFFSLKAHYGCMFIARTERKIYKGTGWTSFIILIVTLYHCWNYNIWQISKVIHLLYFIIVRNLERVWLMDLQW